MAMDPLARALNVTRLIDATIPTDPLAISVTDRIAMMEQMAGFEAVFSAAIQEKKAQDGRRRDQSPPPSRPPQEAFKALLLAYRDAHPEATMRDLVSDLSQGSVPIDLVRPAIDNDHPDLYLIQPIADGYPELRSAAETLKADLERQRREGLENIGRQIAELKAQHPNLDFGDEEDPQ